MADLTAGIVPRAAAATEIQDSAFADPGGTGLTITPLSVAGAVLGEPGLAVESTTDTVQVGVVTTPKGNITGKGFIEADSFGTGLFSIIDLYSARGTQTSPTALQTSDTVGQINFAGRATANQVGARVGTQATENWATHFGTLLNLQTCATGDALLRTRIRIDGTGNTNIMNGVLVLPTGTPSSASDSGVTGTVTWDASFVYVCVATNTWKRVAIASW
jgi:hypothetical protein